MAKRELSEQELHERAYDSYDFPDYDENEPDDDLDRELDAFIQSVINAPDPSAKSK